MIVIEGDFEWDSDKNATNIRKHGVDFSLASRIFEGFVLTELDETFDYGEVREISIGAVQAIVVLTVIHTDRGERLRIISARKATPSERANYEATLRKRTHT